MLHDAHLLLLQHIFLLRDYNIPVHTVSSTTNAPRNAPGQLACNSFLIMLQQVSLWLGGISSIQMSYLSSRRSRGHQRGDPTFFPSGAEYKLSPSHAWTCPSSPPNLCSLDAGRGRNCGKVLTVGLPFLGGVQRGRPDCRGLPGSGRSRAWFPFPRQFIFGLHHSVSTSEIKSHCGDEEEEDRGGGETHLVCAYLGVSCRPSFCWDVVQVFLPPKRGKVGRVLSPPYLVFIMEHIRGGGPRGTQWVNGWETERLALGQHSSCTMSKWATQKWPRKRVVWEKRNFGCWRTWRLVLIIDARYPAGSIWKLSQNWIVISRNEMLRAQETFQLELQER